MFRNVIGSFFASLGRLLDRVWGASVPTFLLAGFMLACGVVLSALALVFGAAHGQVWLYFKWGAFLGFAIWGIRFLIRKVAVPQARVQQQPPSRQAKREAAIELARARALSNREALSKRLETLH